MIDLLGPMLVPAAIACVAHFGWRAKISWKEALVQLGVSSVLVLVVFLAARYASVSSVEHLNGRVSDKDSGTESCCHCRSVCDSRDSKGSCTSSHTSCDHSRDYWWSVKIDLGEHDHPIEDGCNGDDDPPTWWSSARLGEPGSVEHSYTNYLLADPESLFSHRTARKEDLDVVPKWIPEIREKFRTDKVITHGMPKPAWLEQQISEIDAELGPSKQVDVIVYLTTSDSPEFAEAVEQRWVYGPKNALVVVLGIADGTIAWARAVTFSKVEQLKIEIRDELPGHALEPATIAKLAALVDEHWDRTPMADYEYLMSAASPSGWWLFLVYFVAVSSSVAIAIYFHHEDVFGDERWLAQQ